MARSISRSPSHRRRRSPSPADHPQRRRSRRADRIRSSYSRSHSRRKSDSDSPPPRRHQRSRSPSYRRRKSRSPTPSRRRRRHRSRSRTESLSPLSRSRITSIASTKIAVEKLKKEEEEKKRRQLEAELNLLEEETTRRLEESIRKNVEDKLNSEEVQSEIERRIEEGQKKLFDDVVAQLLKEKEAALVEERRKEAQARKEREELDKMLKENSRRVEESQRREALEQQRKDEERFCELELIKRQKEEVAWRKKLEVEEDHTNQMKLSALAIFALVFSHAFSTSRRVLEHPKAQNGFRVKLKHVDSGKNLTKFERIQHGVKRGRHRLQRFKAMALVASSNSEIDAPVLPGNGEFLMNLAIGTPPATYSAIMDTGSDLIWTQCKPCTQCFDQPTPIFDPKKSSSFSKLSCSSKLCEALPQSTCSDGCEYLYGYGDYSSTQGILASETLTFGKVSVPKVAFGCGEDNEGSGFSQGSGLVGLGRGPLSLVSQLKEPKFSYCLTSVDDTKASTLLMGSLASVKASDSEIKSTPLIQNSAQPSFYYLSLEGISVGDTSLPIKKSTFSLQEDGSGGLIIDSGTTITYLEQSAFDLVAKEFTSQMNLPVDNSGATGLEVCFTLPSGSTDIEVPKLVFHFDGADLELPAENYMIADASMGVACLAMGSSSGMSIFGNIQQQNMLVLHDLEKETLSFLPAQCDEL